METQTNEKPKKPRTKKTEQVTEPITKSNEIVVTELTELLDWKIFIPGRYFEINPSWLAENGITIDSTTTPEQKEELKQKAGEDNLLILLAGFKYLAHLRGCNSVRYIVDRYDNEIITKCSVSFGETKVKYKDKEYVFAPSIYEGVAGAHENNTSYPYSLFLPSMAENRAFIRAIKMACNICILGSEELQSSPNSFKPILSDDGCLTPQASLRQIIEMKGRSFADLKESLKKQDWPNCEQWNDFKDIPAQECLEISNKILNKSNKGTQV